MMGATRNRYPFTAAQWEEFEQQALIYKYMLSGVAVPPQLLLSIKRSLDDYSSLVFPSQSTLGGWGGSYGDNEIEGNAGGMSYGWGGRRIDTEPGRCRRTDGKKWRCSKEAHPDSRYCERHMHRGRNRTNSCSRKPVEFHFSTATTNTTPPTTIMSRPTSSSVMPTSLSHDYQNPLLYPSLHHPDSSSSSTSRPSLATLPHFLDSTLPYTQHNKNHRYLQEMRDMQGETERAYRHDPYTTLKMNPSHHFHFQSLIDKSKEDQNEQQRRGQHCYVLGTDIKLAASSTSIAEVEGTGGDQENQNKPFHHFFSDWPPPTRPSRKDPATCIDDIVDSQSNLASTSTAPLLSISMPLSIYNGDNPNVDINNLILNLSVYIALCRQMRHSIHKLVSP